MCYVDMGDIEAAQRAYEKMPETMQDDSATKYGLFQLAVKTQDMVLATDCLKSLSQSSDCSEMLHACVMFSRKAKSREFTVKALKRLADIINHAEPGYVNKPALFRCTILLLYDLIEELREASKEEGDEKHVQMMILMRDLCSVCEGVAEAIKISRHPDTRTERPDFPLEELEWFVTKIFTMGTHFSKTWNLRNTADIMMTCVKIIEQFPADLKREMSDSLVEKKLKSHFVAAAALGGLAWESLDSNSMEQAREHFQVVREHVAIFETILMHTGPPHLLMDHREKLSYALILDFEAAMALDEWDDLEMICEMSGTCNSAKTCGTLGDYLIRWNSSIPGKNFVNSMGFIIDHLQGMPGFSNMELIKYFRCLFQVALYRENEMALEVLGQVVQVAKKEVVHRGENEWPDDEMCFLSAMAFNEGVDWFLTGDVVKLRKWSMLAKDLAEMCNDGVARKNMIIVRFALLGVGELEIQPSVEVDM